MDGLQAATRRAPDLTTFTLSPENDADRRALRHFLVSQFAYERARRIREELLLALAASSSAVWVLAVWPKLFGTADVRALILEIWAVVFLGAVGAAFAEQWLRLRSERARNDLPPA